MLKSANLKVQRANHHAAELKRQFEIFVALKPHRFGVGHDPKTGKPVIQIRFLRELPSELAPVIGDAVHNLRSALDHMTWDVIGHDGGTQDRDLQFPCRGTRDEYTNACKKLKTPSDWVRQLFLDFEAFPGGKGSLFYLLNRLDIADKHRSIGIMMGATGHPPFQIFNADGTPSVRMEGNIFAPSEGMGDRIAIAQVPDGGSVELEHDASCPPSIFFKEESRGNVFEVLNAIGLSVVNALKGAEIAMTKNPRKG